MIYPFGILEFDFGTLDLVESCFVNFDAYLTKISKTINWLILPLFVIDYGFICDWFVLIEYLDEQCQCDSRIRLCYWNFDLI